MLKSSMLQLAIHPLRQAYRDLLIRPKGNIACLDFLRTFAVMLIFSGHAMKDLHAPAYIFRIPLIYFDWTGVDLFFVLSGFLIGKQL